MRTFLFFLLLLSEVALGQSFLYGFKKEETKTPIRKSSCVELPPDKVLQLEIAGIPVEARLWEGSVGSGYVLLDAILPMGDAAAFQALWPVDSNRGGARDTNGRALSFIVLYTDFIPDSLQHTIHFTDLIAYSIYTPSRREDYLHRFFLQDEPYSARELRKERGVVRALSSNRVYALAERWLRPHTTTSGSG